MASVGAHGHVNPNLPVIAELVERGHRVSYAIPASFAEVVASTGATPVVYRTQLPDESAGEQWPTDPLDGMTIFFEEATRVLPQLEAALEDDRPDAVLYDITGYPARVLAHRWSVPLLQLSPSMVAWQGFEEDMADAFAFLSEPAGLAYRARFDEWLAEQGVPLRSDEFTGRPPRCAVLIPKALQPNADRVDDSVYTFVGPALDRRPHQGGWPSGDRPLLLVSLGSAYTDHLDLYLACIEAFRDTEWDVVMSIGVHVNPADLGELPPNITVHRWVPQLAVLGQASAFVTHAGMGGCSEGLYQGVPMVALPQAVDQFGNAAMLAELGVGAQLAEPVTADALREAVLSLAASPEVAARLAELRAELRAAGGASAAADIVEQLLA
ncbi:macrolide family glycosyltransferase [Pseudonocardia spinosispora]|uniref:macrolide family glycosyltransferase n=1 Tax=Pseudonocardia spinosispora TaxID=103441 RepID=UPI0007E8DAC2